MLVVFNIIKTFPGFGPWKLREYNMFGFIQMYMYVYTV